MARENRAQNRREAKQGANPFEVMTEELEEEFNEEIDDSFIEQKEEDNDLVDDEKSANKDDLNIEEVKLDEEVETETDTSLETEVADESKKVEEEKKEEEVKAEPAKITEPADEDEDKVLSDEEAGALYGDWRNTTEKLLADHHYHLSEDDVNELNENPAAYIPKAMARVYLDAISASMQQVVTMMPNLVSQVLDARTEVKKLEDQFFEAWPELAPHKEKVFKMGRAYRNANPQSTVEDFTNEVGAAAMVALKLVREKKEEAPKPKPHKPAVANGAATPPVRQSDNPFEALVSEFSEEIEDN